MSRQEQPAGRSKGSAPQEPLLESKRCALPSRPESYRSRSPREIEVRYFVHDDVATRLTEGKHYLVIEQHYFTSKGLRDLISRHGIDGAQADSAKFSSARVRRIRDEKEREEFMLEFKGPKENAGGARISRLEFSVPISESLFDKLKDEATAGSLKKRRYVLSGRIEGPEGYEQVEGHLDILRRAGIGLPRVRPEVATIDIELPSARLLPGLRGGRHSFKFLAECVEISRLDPETQGLISNSTLAEKGVDGSRREAFRELQHEAERLVRLYRKLRE